MSKESCYSTNEGVHESLGNNRLNVAIVCLYGFPQKHDSEPFAGQTLKALLDQKFPDTVASQIYLLGHDNEKQNEVDTLARKLVENDRTQIIGISIPQGTHQLADEFLSALDKLKYKGLKILGHALPTYLPENFINSFPDALIIRGWAEESFCSIVEKELKHSKDLSGIPNLTYLRDGKTINNEIQWPDVFVPPIRYDVQNFFPRIEASRGCHHDRCTFCTRPLREKSQSPWIRIPPEIVIQGIKDLNKHGVNTFTFTDEDFIGNDLSGALQIAEGIKQIGSFNFALDLRADSILNPSDSPVQAYDRDLLIKTLKDAGLSLVYIGAETFSETQLKRYGKGVSSKDEIASINKIIDLGIPMELGLITFDPILSIQELSENVRMIEDTGLWRYSGQLFNELHVFEGNPYCNILKRAKLDTGFDPDFMTYSYSYKDSEIERIRNVCIPFKKEFDSVYTSARNIFRTNFKIPGPINEYLTHYRKNELIMLKELLKNPLHDKKILKDARHGEYLRIQILRIGLQDNFLDTKPEYNELMNNINRYVESFR